MTSTQNNNYNFFRGCPCDHVDGDVAALEEQTASRLKARSRKETGAALIPVQSSASPPKSGLGGLSSSQTTNNPELYSRSRSEAGNSAIMTNEQNAIEKEQELIGILNEMTSEKNKIWNGIGKKRGIRIATLNVNGRRDDKRRDKWPKLISQMRSQGVAILGVQESHLNVEETDALNERFKKAIILNNGSSTVKGGVTFVLNKDLVNGMRWEHTPIIEGRVSRLEIETEKDRGMNIVLLYAPNEDKDKANFWNTLKLKLEELGELENLVMLGDFNSVENALDRYPHREDDGKVKQEWKKIKDKFKLVDGWRMHNPLKKDYTYMQKSTGSMSRIDRIYMNKRTCLYGYNWNHVETGISDHNMVTVDVLKEKLPFIGKGVWRMYQDDIDNKIVIKRITKLLKVTNDRMNEIKEGKREDSIQRIWMKAKKEIKAVTVEERKIREKQMKRQKNSLKNSIAERLEKITEEANEVNQQYKKEIKELKEKLAWKVRKDTTKMQVATRARYRQKGEKCTKYWFGLHKERLDDNIILTLTDKEGKMTKDTRKMGEIAVEHHEKLQAKPVMTDERRKAISELEKIIEGKTINGDQVEMLNKKTSRGEIEDAIKSAANGTSPGTDGIPYEMYKEIIKNEKKKENGVDIIGLLHNVIEDIEEKGVEVMSKEGKKESEFTDGLMFLLYKKKEKWRIENYRPITLLNTDYKIYTKTIAKRLAKIAPTIVHEDQAGFIPKRSLYEHTRTTQLVVEYCELVEMNGCIVALDQEKAYDKIDHEYLWIILKKYGLPEAFVNRVKEMYKNTSKAIMINGIVTRKYDVKRGVHQGDPMSCILYDLAIEPLAEALRRSDLKGIEIKGNVEKLLVNLFADDTLVYLRENDNINVLEKVIEVFCTASTAKFNMDKTEILPIGKREFRERMIETRKMGENEITDDKRIIKEGESMRTLGSWVGNAKTDTLQWEKVIKSQEKVLEIWSKQNLTTKGKELILKSLVQSKAVFLATVNGMPIEVQNEMTKMYHDFVWNGKKRGLIKWDQAIVKRSEGGLGMPDIKARVEAIEVMWVKKWLSQTDKRPRWAFILDMILNETIAKQPIIDEKSRISWIMQTWHESEAKDVNLSGNIKRMLKVARKYNINPIAPKYDSEAKRKMPLWHNMLMKSANYQWNKKSARCLRENHRIKTVGDLIGWSTVKDCTKACNSMTDRLIGMIPEKINPLTETPIKVKRARLDLTPKRLKKNVEEDNKKVFNPDITTRQNWEEAIRIFMKKRGPKTRRIKENGLIREPAYRNEPDPQRVNTLVTMSIKDRGRVSELIKVVIKMKVKETKVTKMITFKMKEGENEDKARAVALLWILKRAKDKKLYIKTDDKKMVTWVGEKLNKAEDNGWIGIENKEMWKSVLRKLRRRGNVTKIKRVNEDSKTRTKLRKLKEDLENDEGVNEIELRIGRSNVFNREGARMDLMSQKKAYELIMDGNGEHPGGAGTWVNMIKIKEAMAERNKRVNESEVWRSLEGAYSPQLNDFIWKMIHGRIKCGPFFRFMPNWQEKEFCACGASETIEHILLLCEESGQKELWDVVKEMWKKETGVEMIQVNIGLIMGIGCLEIENSKKMEQKAATELFRKLVLITIWVIWKERNDRIFNEKEVSPRRLLVRWVKELKREIKFDLWEGVVWKKKKANKKIWTTNGTFVEVIKGEDGKEKVKIVVVEKALP